MLGRLSKTTRTHAAVLFGCCVSYARAFLPHPVMHTSTPTRTSPPKTHTDLFMSLSTTWAYPWSFQDTTGFAFQNDQTSAWFAPTRSKNLPQHMTTRRQPHDFRLFCDLDGVLVDFETGIRQLFPERSFSEVTSFHIPNLERSTMWRRVQDADAFFEKLPWTREGQRLWGAIQHLQPDILTGVPQHPSSRIEKLRWCQRELGVDVHHVDMAGKWRSHANVNGMSKQDNAVNVITCWSDNKHYESGPNCILIDDREFLRAGWEAAGGIFVHHYGDVDATFERLEEIGVLVNDPDESMLLF